MGFIKRLLGVVWKHDRYTLVDDETELQPKRSRFKEFNAVVEGASQDSWGQHDAKLVYIEVPQRKEELKSGNQTFKFYGHTDFQTVSREEYRMPAYEQDDAAADHVSSQAYRGYCDRPDLISDGFAERTVTIDDVTWCAGLSTFSSTTQILPRPRAIIMRNGDIYVENHMLSDSNYLEALDAIVPQMAEYFSSKEIEQMYAKAVTPT